MRSSAERTEYMSFTAAGPVIATVDDVKLAEPKFAKGEHDFDICLHLIHKDDPAQADWWRGEISQNYGRGNFATMTQAEITLKELHGVGFEGVDLTEAKSQLVGKDVPAFIKATEKEGRVYYNVNYLGSGGGDQPKEITADVAKARLAALFGASAAADQAPPPPPPTQAAAKSNPFAKA